MKSFFLGFWAVLALILSLYFLKSDNYDPNTIVVGISADNPPYEYMKNGKVEGFEIDIINEIASRLGKKIVFKDMDFQSLIASLINNKVDMVIAAMSNTSERKARILFSSPYTSSRVAILFHRGKEFFSINDLSNKNVGVQLGTTCSLLAHELARSLYFKVNILSNNLMLLEELKSSRVDALILDESIANKFALKSPELQVLPLEKYSSDFSIAYAKGYKQYAEIEKIIKMMHSTGIIKALEEKWGIISEE